MRRPWRHQRSADHPTCPVGGQGQATPWGGGASWEGVRGARSRGAPLPAPWRSQDALATRAGPVGAALSRRPARRDLGAPDPASGPDGRGAPAGPR